MDPLQVAYFSVQSEMAQIKQLTEKSAKTEEPELKQAYELIKATHVSTLTSLQQNLLTRMGIVVSEMKPTEQK